MIIFFRHHPFCILFTLSLILTSELTQAQSSRDVNLQFQSFYRSSEIDPRKCGANVDKFIQLLARKNILPPQFKRVVIRAPQSNWHPEGMLISVGSRFGNQVSPEIRLDMWYFHVVGMLNNHIYDFSFSQEPRILPVDTYLQEMFVPKVPFMVFGRSFRIRGNGPYYGPKDGLSELEQFSYEISRVNHNANSTIEITHSNLDDFLNWQDH